MKRAACALVLILATSSAMAGMLVSVGKMLGTSTRAGGGPPAVTFYITTESGNILATESGNKLVTEAAP